MSNITERHQTDQVIGLHHQGVPQATRKKVGIDQVLQRDVGRDGRRFGIHDLTHGHATQDRSEEHTSELQSHSDLVCRLLLEKKKKNNKIVKHNKNIIR